MKRSLVSIMYANNEIGTIQPIAEIVKIINNFKKNSFSSSVLCPPFFHTDASQAFQFLDCDTTAPNIDFMTLSSHKIYGPKGAGALYMNKQNALTPIITGGGQEFGVRAGTENIPAIVGFAKATEQLTGLRKAANDIIAELRNHLWRGIKKIVSQGGDQWYLPTKIKKEQPTDIFTKHP